MRPRSQARTNRAGFRRIVISCTLFAVAAASSAGAQFVVGIEGGLNISNLTVTEDGQPPAIPYDSRTDVVVGAMAGFGVTPWLSVQLAGRYSREGTQQTEDELTASLRVSYLDLPLVAEARIPVGESPVVPHVFAGGFVQFETSCGVQIRGTVSLDLDCETADAERRSTDYGLVFGGGADVRLGPGAITLDVEYALGLRNMATDPAIEAKSRVLAFVAGYKLTL